MYDPNIEKYVSHNSVAEFLSLLLPILVMGWARLDVILNLNPIFDAFVDKTSTSTL